MPLAAPPGPLWTADAKEPHPKATRSSNAVTSKPRDWSSARIPASRSRSSGSAATVRPATPGLNSRRTSSRQPATAPPSFDVSEQRRNRPGTAKHQRKLADTQVVGRHRISQTAGEIESRPSSNMKRRTATPRPRSPDARRRCPQLRTPRSLNSGTPVRAGSVGAPRRRFLTRETDDRRQVDGHVIAAPLDRQMQGAMHISRFVSLRTLRETSLPSAGLLVILEV